MLAEVYGANAQLVWHKDNSLGGAELVVLPGGFSYGDYLRTGAMAKFSPVMAAVHDHAQKGKPVLGICNGFQILCETGLLPGVLIRNRQLRFICDDVRLKLETDNSPFFSKDKKGAVVTMPIKHGEGNFFADPETLNRIEGEGQVAFRYVDTDGNPTEAANPNGTLNNIAGIVSAGRNVLGLMPHPEHACESILGSEGGRIVFDSLLGSRKP